jgi:hypothetical protein
MLRRYGTYIFYEPEVYPPRNELPNEVIMSELQKMLAQKGLL